MNTELAEAVRGHRVLSFGYEDLERVVEPHLYGLHAKTNKETLLAYQIGGSSRSSAPPGWRNFLVFEIRDLKLTGQSFGSARPGYNPHDARFRIVFARA
jgi:hypothetical protein